MIKPVIIIIEDDTRELLVRCIEALEIERNNAICAGDPDPDALILIDEDIRRLGFWADWLPERLRKSD